MAKNKGDGFMFGNIAGQALGQMLADLIEHFTTGHAAESQNEKGRGGTQPKPQLRVKDDLAGRIVLVLHRRGALPLARLLRQTRAGLSPLLLAVRSLQQAHLTEFDETRATLRLTESGTRVAETLCQLQER